mgnify:CR=1 FL=1
MYIFLIENQVLFGNLQNPIDKQEIENIMIYIPRYYVYMEIDFARRYMEVEE